MKPENNQKFNAKFVKNLFTRDLQKRPVNLHLEYPISGSLSIGHHKTINHCKGTNQSSRFLNRFRTEKLTEKSTAAYLANKNIVVAYMQNILNPSKQLERCLNTNY
jgi:hypothetical protein